MCECARWLLMLPLTITGPRTCEGTFIVIFHYLAAIYRREVLRESLTPVVATVCHSGLHVPRHIRGVRLEHGVGLEHLGVSLTSSWPVR